MVEFIANDCLFASVKAKESFDLNEILVLKILLYPDLSYAIFVKLLENHFRIGSVFML